MSDSDNLESESEQPPIKKAKSHYDTLSSHHTQQSSQGSQNIIIETGHHQDQLNTRHTVNVIVNNKKKERQKRYREQNRDKLKQREAERRNGIQYSQSIAGPSAFSSTNRIELNNGEIITAISQSSSGLEKPQPSSIQRNEQGTEMNALQKKRERQQRYREQNRDKLKQREAERRRLLQNAEMITELYTSPNIEFTEIINEPMIDDICTNSRSVAGLGEMQHEVVEISQQSGRDVVGQPSALAKSTLAGAARLKKSILVRKVDGKIQVIIPAAHQHRTNQQKNISVVETENTIRNGPVNISVVKTENTIDNDPVNISVVKTEITIGNDPINKSLVKTENTIDNDPVNISVVKIENTIGNDPVNISVVKTENTIGIDPVNTSVVKTEITIGNDPVNMSLVKTENTISNDPLLCSRVKEEIIEEECGEYSQQSMENSVRKHPTVGTLIAVASANTQQQDVVVIKEEPPDEELQLDPVVFQHIDYNC